MKQNIPPPPRRGEMSQSDVIFILIFILILSLCLEGWFPN